MLATCELGECCARILSQIDRAGWSHSGAVDPVTTRDSRVLTRPRRLRTPNNELSHKINHLKHSDTTVPNTPKSASANTNINQGLATATYHQSQGLHTWSSPNTRRMCGRWRSHHRPSGVRTLNKQMINAFVSNKSKHALDYAWHCGRLFLH